MSQAEDRQDATTSTRMIRMQCPACRKVTTGPAKDFLQARECPQCNGVVNFIRATENDDVFDPWMDDSPEDDSSAESVLSTPEEENSTPAEPHTALSAAPEDAPPDTGEADIEEEVVQIDDDEIMVCMACPNCKVTMTGPPEEFLNPITCPACKEMGIFHRSNDIELTLLPDESEEVPDDDYDDNEMLDNDNEEDDKSILSSHNDEPEAEENSLADEEDESVVARLQCPRCNRIVKGNPEDYRYRVECPACEEIITFNRLEDEISSSKVTSPSLEPQPFIAPPPPRPAILPWILLLFLTLGTGAYLIHEQNGKDAPRYDSEQKKLLQIMAIGDPDPQREELQRYLAGAAEAGVMDGKMVLAIKALEKINSGIITALNEKLSESQLEIISLQKEMNESLSAQQKNNQTQEETIAELRKKLAEMITEKEESELPDPAEVAALRLEVDRLTTEINTLRTQNNARDKAAEKALYDAAARALPAVVSMTVQQANGDVRQGCGVVVSYRHARLIVTTAKLLHLGYNIRLRDSANNSAEITSLMMINTEKNIALLSVPEELAAVNAVDFSKTIPSPGARLPLICAGTGEQDPVAFVHIVRHLKGDHTTPPAFMVQGMDDAPENGSVLLSTEGKLLGLFTATNKAIDLAILKNISLPEKPTPLNEINATKVYLAKREEAERARNRRAAKIRDFFREGYEMSETGLMFKRAESRAAEAEGDWKIELQLANPDGEAVHLEKIYLLGTHLPTGNKFWAETETPDLPAAGSITVTLHLKGFNLSAEKLDQLRWEIFTDSANLNHQLGDKTP